jgi:hypothetical protein
MKLKIIVSFIYTVLIFQSANGYEKIVYIIPPAGYQNEKLFDMSDLTYNRDDCMRPFFNMRESLRKIGFDLKTTTLADNESLDKFAGIIVCGVPHDVKTRNKLAQYPANKVALVLLEPPVVVPYFYDRSLHSPFGKVFSMLDGDVDNIKYFKLYYPQTTLKMIDPVVPFNEKKSIVMIASDKTSKHVQEQYSERRKIIDFFELNAAESFDLFGHAWDNKFHVYKGSVKSKIDTLKQYKFCICYENMKDIDGYVTEKIFDVFISGCVPVYKGAKNITSFVDKECFIDRDQFQSDQELYDFLKNMSEEQYNHYIDAIKNYLTSSKAFLFSSENFIFSIVSAVIDNVKIEQLF